MTKNGKKHKATVEEMLNEIIRITRTTDNPFVLGLANSIITEYNRVVNIVRQPENTEERE